MTMKLTDLYAIMANTLIDMEEREFQEFMNSVNEARSLDFVEQKPDYSSAPKSSN